MTKGGWQSSSFRPKGSRSEKRPVHVRSQAEPNALELAYGRHLDGDPFVIWWAYQPFKLRIGSNVWYTPDFVAIRNTNGEGVGRLEVSVEETKGAYAREDSIIKIKTAAALYPCFVFAVVQRGPLGTWRRESINGVGFQIGLDSRAAAALLLNGVLDRFPRFSLSGGGKEEDATKDQEG